MAYTINLTNETPLVTISDGTIDTDATNLVLIGRNYTGYGEFVAENFVRALENSANITPPANPLVGQLWYDTNNNVLKIADNAKEFKSLGTISPSITEPLPSTSSVGDIWYDTVNEQVNVYTGSEYILVGGTNVTGSTVTTILDSGSAPHTITTFYADSEVVGAASVDPAFTVLATDALFAKFPTMSPGFQLAQSVAGGTPQFIGDATNALALGGTLAANFLRSDGNDQTSGTLTVLNDGGITVGTGLNGKLSTFGADVILKNTNAAGNIILQSNTTPVIVMSGATGKATVASPTPSTNQIANANYVNTVSVARDGSNTIDGVIVPDGDGTRDLGAVAARFANIHSVAFTGALVGNADTVTNGVYTTGNQTINGTKTFSSQISGDITSLGGYAASNWTRKTEYATSTVGGTLKARLSGSTLYLSNNGVNP